MFGTWGFGSELSFAFFLVLATYGRPLGGLPRMGLLRP